MKKSKLGEIKLLGITTRTSNTVLNIYIDIKYAEKDLANW